HVGRCAEEGAQLDGNRNADILLHRPQNVEVELFDLRAGVLNRRGDVVDVQLQRVRPGFLDLARVLHPAASRNAVQAADDGDVDRLLGAGDQVEVLLRTQIVVRDVGVEVDGLGVDVPVVGGIV